MIEFRDKATIGQCRDILVEATQHNGNDAVKFQASAALKAAFPRDCVTLHRGRKYAAVGFAMIASERADIGLAVALHKNFHRTNRRRTDPLEEDPLLALLECLKQARCAFLSSYFFYSQHESPSLMAPFSHSAKECF